MTIPDVKDLSAEDRQLLINALYQEGLRPQIRGAGSPAHIDALTGNLNDLRTILSAVFQLVAPRTGPTANQPPPRHVPDQPDE